MFIFFFRFSSYFLLFLFRYLRIFHSFKKCSWFHKKCSCFSIKVQKFKNVLSSIFCSEFEKMFLVQKLFMNSKNIRVSKFLFRVQKVFPLTKICSHIQKCWWFSKKVLSLSNFVHIFRKCWRFLGFSCQIRKVLLLKNKHFFKIMSALGIWQNVWTYITCSFARHC